MPRWRSRRCITGAALLGGMFIYRGTDATGRQKLPRAERIRDDRPCPDREHLIFTAAGTDAEQARRDIGSSKRKKRKGLASSVCVVPGTQAHLFQTHFRASSLSEICGVRSVACRTPVCRKSRRAGWLRQSAIRGNHKIERAGGRTTRAPATELIPTRPDSPCRCICYPASPAIPLLLLSWAQLGQVRDSRSPSSGMGWTEVIRI